MKVFITGATGYVGSGVARALADAGHDVLGLARSEESRRSLEDEGHDAVDGDLTEPDGLAAAARAADGVVHAANTNGPDAPAVDDAAVRAMVGALEGSDRPFVYTSGIWVLGATAGDGPATEDSPRNPAPLVAWRGELEPWLEEAAGRGVRTVIIRPGIVYGRGGGIPGMIAAGDLPIIGDGENRWPVVHVDDLGRLYVAALEEAPAGSVLHGVGDVVRQREVGERYDATPMPLAAAREQMGEFAATLALDQNISARRTGELLGWEPREPGILEAG